MAFSRHGLGHCLAHHDGLLRCPRRGTVNTIDPLEQQDEVVAALGLAGDSEKLPRYGVARAERRNLFRLPRGRHAQIGAALHPGAGKIRMGERFAFMGVQQHNVAGLRLRFAQGEPKPAARKGVGALTAFQGVARPASIQTPFFRSTTESRDLEMVTPVRRSISDESRGSVQFGRSATGAERISSTTESAVIALIRGRPVAVRRQPVNRGSNVPQAMRSVFAPSAGARCNRRWINDVASIPPFCDVP